MITRNLILNTKTRRKGSMLQNSICKIKYLFVLALILAVPMGNAWAGFPFNFFEPVDQTDTGAFRLVYYWDIRGRDTIFQVTNVSEDTHFVHVQIFNANDVCDECDFDAKLTAGDSNVYDVKDLPGCDLAADGFGLITITSDNYLNIAVLAGDVQTRLVSSDDFAGPLIGMFRIIDADGGYEYRTNAANTESLFNDRKGMSIGQGSFLESELYNILNFNAVTDNQFSDVVGITYVALPDGNTLASPFIGTQFGGIDSFEQNLIFDDDEFPNSCSPTAFYCANTKLVELNKGIDNSVPNSRGADEICSTSKLDGVSAVGTTDSGWLLLGFQGNWCFDGRVGDPVTGECFLPTYFAGFLGLNNGDGTGSMDSWISVSELIYDYTFCAFDTGNENCLFLESVNPTTLE